MLTKILLTATVIIAVYLFYRGRPRPGATATKSKTPVPPPADNRFGRMAAYGFIGILVLISSIIYYFSWVEDHRVVTIRVIDGRSDQITVYKAYRKSLKGNRFESLDGRTVILGEAERVELTEDP